MNDFQEVQHGWDCLTDSYHSAAGLKFRSALEAVSPGLYSEVEKLFDGWMPKFAHDTYVACFSEHADSEDGVGRLSMWRAYGGDAGVALVFRPAPFLSDSTALNIFSSPVSYLDSAGVAAELIEVAEAVERDSRLLRGLSREELARYVFNMFRVAVLCTKHPGFHEEREWRAIYNPCMDSSNRVRTEVEVVRGVPQPVTKVPLVSYPQEGLIGLELPELIDRVIIGPTQYPQAMREAFVSLLLDAHVEDAETKVIVSNIPLRQ